MRTLAFIFVIFFTLELLGQQPSDCTTPILVCGNVNFGLEPDGVGFDEFSLPGNIRPSCYHFNLNTIWLKFEFDSDGVFIFDLIPINGTDDYDFAIFGPNVTCEELGAPIRCSSTNPQAAGVPANTGLNMEETDHSEGPGEDGNGYLQFIDVLAGDVFYMIIDRPHGSGKFDLAYTGTAELPPQPVAHSIGSIVECEMDAEVDESIPIDFEPFIPEIIQSQTGVSVSFHESLNDANIGVNDLSSPYFNTENPQTIYYRVEIEKTGCFDINEFTITVEQPFQLELPDDLIVCDNQEEPVILGTRPGYAYYEWSTGTEGPDTNEIEITESGVYWVIATNTDGCKVKTETVVEAGRAPLISQVIVEDFNFTHNFIVVEVEGTDEYEYALDNDFYFQTENRFTGVSRGYHTVYVKDDKGCGIASQQVLVLDYPRFFTPNGDGINDTWQIIGINELPATRMKIYDRYGKILKELSPLSEGWDGIYN
ncbi:MAG: T9SS type B sorting domain-containing protein, partial [Flavobacteriaceae bacterium]|nr:T9SS type B sorting domain-containing protein [Flavobacteriaceae bacterium]